MTRLRNPRLLSLCSGIGGIDLAWEMAGGEIAGQCELDDYCQRVLARHWPDAQRVADIRSVWGDSFDGPIDLVAGGIPCQPWSVAGKRRGHADDRHLWPEMRRIVAIYQPAWVLIENVAGFARLALDDVLVDLGADGYEASAVMVPAAALGAPHLRERIFVVAHAQRGIGRRVARCLDDAPSGCQHEQHAASGSRAGSVANANQYSGRWAQRAERRDVAGAAGADAAREGHLQRLAAECGGEDVADHDCQRPQRDVQLHCATQTRQQVSARRQTRRCDAYGRRAGQAQPRMGRDANGLPGRLDGTGLAVDLIPPRHAWPAFRGEAQHAWEPPRVTQERIPDRAARLKALGNAVVPQQVYPILAAICRMWQEEQREEQAER